MKTIGRKLLSLLLAMTIAFGCLANVAYALPLEDKPKELRESYAEKKAAMLQEERENTASPLDDSSGGMIYTSYIQCVIHSDGVYNIGTSDGDCLLYAYPNGATSDTLIRIDSQDYFFDEHVSNITISDDQKTCVATATIDGVLVTQTLKIIKNPNSSTENVISIKYTCQNTTSASKTIGVRIMMDTMLGDNDGAPFRINGNDVTAEVEFRGNNIPQYYQAMDSLTNPSLTATGYFFYSAAEKPDKVQFAYWPDIRRSAWDYQVDSNCSLTGDSAVAAYFNEETVAAGASVSAGTYYGAYQTNTAGSYESFPYTNDRYYQELAEICGEYSAYAYENYKYNTVNDLFYEDKDNAKKDTEKNNRSKVLNDALKADNFLGIVSAHYSEPTEDSATYTLAHKTVNHNGVARDLIVVVIRGTNKVEWKGNMNVTGTSYNSQSYHDSFQNGANQIESHLMRYLNTYTDISNPMVLITGHSRGGGIGNLLAADLTADKVERIDENSIFAYLFAVPNVSTSYDTTMTNIYNFCYTDDFVPSLPLNEKWGYGKNGKTFTVTADDITDNTFLYREAISVDCSEGFLTDFIEEFNDNNVIFDAAKTKSVINYVKNNWQSVSAYYNQIADSVIADTLYEFMHDTVGPAAIGNKWNSVVMVAAQNSDTYGKIAKFFVDGLKMRRSINETHQMYTYYNGLTTGMFPTGASVSAADKVLTADPATVEDHSAQEQAALIAFANTGSNLEALGWDLEDTSTWTGITWDDSGRITGICLCYSGLTGSLDLSSFNCLTEVDVSGNALEGLTLPAAESSVLSWLDCSYNELTELDISGQPLELLDCSGNYLDAEAIAAAAANIRYVSCAEQKSTEEIVYSSGDCAVLAEKVLTNGEFWDTSAAPDTWVGVSWTEDNGTYYVSRLDISGRGLAGELDVSGLAHLEVLHCSDNSITSIDASGCDDLKFINCNYNQISEIILSDAAQLESISCSDNYLSEEALSALNAETVNSGHQQVQAEVASFCDAEYTVLSAIAETLGFDAAAPGEWIFVTWEKQGDTYHASVLDLADSSLTGALDLSAFEYLKEIRCASTGIESVTLPAHMTALNSYAFYGCTSLSEVNLPEGMTEIGAYAFYNCSALTEIVFPTGLKAIENNAFDMCAGLAQLYFPISVETIGAGAFQNCSNLLAAYFTGNAPACGDGAFMYASIGFTVYHLSDTTGWDNAVWSAYITDIIELLSIHTYPQKMSYRSGETLDTTGLTLLYLNNDGTYRIISEGFTVSCDSLDAPGTYTVTVAYDGQTVAYDVVVRRLSLNNAEIFIDAYNHEYTGEPVTPTVTVIYEGVTLVEGTDYTVEYTNNIGPGYAEICVRGINNYDGTYYLEFFIRNMQTFTVTDWTQLESDHDYMNYCNQTWIYTSPNSDIEYLELTFHEDTYFEDNYDYLDIYTGSDELVGSYTGAGLAGQTVTVPDRTVKLVLRSDSGVEYWGFKVTDVKEGYNFIARSDEATGKPVLKWSAVENAVQYEIWRSVQGADSFERIAVVTEPVYTDQNAEIGTAYSYYVAALDSDGALLEQTAVRDCVCTCPQPVVKVSNVASTGKIKLTWTRVEGAVSYKVYRSTSKDGEYSLMKTTTGTTYTNTSAKAGTQYYYKVRAIAADADASSAYSAIVTRTCDCARPVVKIANVASSGKIKLTWDAVEGAVGYKVYRATSKSGSYTLLKTTTGTTFTNTSAKAGTLYYYYVIAVGSKSAANSAKSEVVSRTCDLAAPTVTLSNVASTGKIKVSWGKIEGAVSYKVYRSTSKTGTYKLLKTTTSTSYTDTSAKAGSTYYYKVIAVHSKSSANSAYSSVKSRTCDLARPNVSIALKSRKPNLTWGKVTGAVSYKVYRSTSKDGTYTLIKTTTSTKYRDTSAKSGTTYYYKVVAVHTKSAANSAYSLVDSIKSK